MLNDKASKNIQLCPSHDNVSACERGPEQVKESREATWSEFGESYVVFSGGLCDGVLRRLLDLSITIKH